jgi:transposase
VPHRFARSEVEVRLTPRAVEIFLKGERIAAHLRASSNHRHTTVSEHMPSSHRRYADWTVERIRREAASIGPATAALCELILERRPHPEQGFRACLGIVRLVRPFGADRLEAAATRAIEIGTLTYGSVRSILDNKLDRQTAQQPTTNGVPIARSGFSSLIRARIQAFLPSLRRPSRPTWRRRTACRRGDSKRENRAYPLRVRHLSFWSFWQL